MLPVPSKDQITEALSIVYKAGLSFLDNTGLISGIIDYKAALSRKRIEKFNNLMIEHIKTHSVINFEPENFTSEHFLDSFEAIMRKVVSTKSEEKLKRYRNVLMKVIVSHTDTEMFFKYLALIDEITDIQILLMSYMPSEQRIISNDYFTELGKFSFHKNYLDHFDAKGTYKLPDGKEVIPDEIHFYLYELQAKGLIEIYSTEHLQIYVNEPIQNAIYYKLTSIGKEFLKFIDEHGK